MLLNKANGMTTMPTLKNCQPVIFTFSLRSAISHKMVAKDPAIDRLGPRSTPMRTALATALGFCDDWTAAPLISPTGRLFMQFAIKATENAATRLPRRCPK